MLKLVMQSGAWMTGINTTEDEKDKITLKLSPTILSLINTPVRPGR